jgi:hypothetical protein
MIEITIITLYVLFNTILLGRWFTLATLQTVTYKSDAEDALTTSAVKHLEIFRLTS